MKKISNLVDSKWGIFDGINIHDPITIIAPLKVPYFSTTYVQVNDIFMYIKENGSITSGAIIGTKHNNSTKNIALKEDIHGPAELRLGDHGQVILEKEGTVTILGDGELEAN
jgi:hypothetical protein